MVWVSLIRGLVAFGLSHQPQRSLNGKPQVDVCFPKVAHAILTFSGSLVTPSWQRLAFLAHPSRFTPVFPTSKLSAWGFEPLVRPEGHGFHRTPPNHRDPNFADAQSSGLASSGCGRAPLGGGGVAGLWRKEPWRMGMKKISQGVTPVSFFCHVPSVEPSVVLPFAQVSCKWQRGLPSPGFLHGFRLP